MLRSPRDTKRRRREALADNFEQAATITATQLGQLVTYAEIVLTKLRQLDEILASLGGIIFQETRINKRDGAEIVRIFPRVSSVQTCS